MALSKAFSANMLLQYSELQRRFPNAMAQLDAALAGLMGELRFGLMTDIKIGVQSEEGKAINLTFQIVHEISRDAKDFDAALILRSLHKQGWDLSVDVVILTYPIPATLKIDEARDRLEYDLDRMKAENAFEVGKFVSAVLSGWRAWMKKAHSIDLDARSQRG